MATHNRTIDFFLSLNFNHWHDIYSRGLLISNKIEFEFLNELIEEFNNTKTKEKTKSEIEMAVKDDELYKKYLNRQGIETATDYQEQTVKRITSRQEENLKKEEFLMRFLKIKLDRFPEIKSSSILNKNPYSNIFKDDDSYFIFNEYISKYILTPYLDLSFLFRKLKIEKRLFIITHLEFAKFLNDKGFISRKVYDVINNKRGFEKNCSSDIRLNNYHLILSDLDKINS
jgi:hypothetical protein